MYGPVGGDGMPVRPHYDFELTGLELDVTLPPHGTPRASDQFLVTIKFATSVDVGALATFIRGGAIEDSNIRRSAHQNAATAVMFVNEVLRRIPMRSVSSMSSSSSTSYYISVQTSGSSLGAMS